MATYKLFGCHFDNIYFFMNNFQPCDVTLTNQAELDERAFFNISLDFFCIIGQDNYFKKFNSAWEVLGWGCQELLSRPWIEFIHPDDVANTKRIIQSLEQDGVKFQNRFRYKDGNYCWLAWTISRYQGVAYGVAHDITKLQSELAESKQLQARLRRSEKVYRTLLENASDCVCHIDLDGKFVYMNQGGVELNELTSASELHGLDCTGSIKPEYREQMYAALDKARQGERTKIEYISVNAKGKELWWNSVVGAITDDNGEVIGLLRSSRNINEEKLHTQVLKEAKEAADIANQAKSEFLANISHELRTPLNGILGYTQIIEREPGLTAKQQEGLAVIYQCGSHLLNLINDILDLSKIEARKMEIVKSDFHFLSFLQSVIEICRIRAEQKGISFVYQTNKNLPIGIHADEKRLRQILINLLSNAIKFTQQGEVNFSVEVITQIANTQQPTYKVRFQTADTGIGINPAVIENIFLPFEQVGKYEKQAEGTGLGLAISQKIVRLMGSNIQVRSEPGGGSVFWFDVDLIEASNWVESATTGDDGKIIGIKGASKKILVVDDRWENRSVLVNLLEAIGFEIAEAVNGQQGLDKAYNFKPDLIISDLAMPVMDGFEMVKQIRCSPTLKDVIVIVSSASAFDTDKYKSLAVGSNDFIPKPIQTDDLLQKLQKHLQLEWLYDQKTQQSTIQLDLGRENVIIAPPEQELEVLFHLAQTGNLKAIITHIERLQQLDEKYVPFVNKIQQMAKNYQMKKIKKFINIFRKIES
jgi:PAS domain S-box-containing protein